MTKYHKLRFFILFCCVIVSTAFALAQATTGGIPPEATQFSDKPEYAILLIIDGLSFESWQRIELPIMKKMIQEGALVERLYIPSAAHPRSGAYSELHTSSIPNPVMMAGSVFINKGTKYLQDSFFPDRPIAFIANSTQYNTLAVNYSVIVQRDTSDEWAVERSLAVIESDHPAFLRLHLQDVGAAGQQSLFDEGSMPWRFNIWAAGSPYRKAMIKADSLIGQIIDGLRRMGILNKTVLFILGDHGQHGSGWHPPDYEESAITTMIVWGAGGEAGIKLDYAELTDVAPTVAAVMNVPPPSTANGRILNELIRAKHEAASSRRPLMKELVSQLTKYRSLLPAALRDAQELPQGQRALAIVRVNGLVREQFYDEYRFVEWPRFQTLEELVNHNGRILRQLQQLVEEFEASKGGKL